MERSLVFLRVSDYISYYVELLISIL
jgi:hypothetical protein